MRANWAPLREELAVWSGEGLSLPVWWRDDDAVSDTPALRTLNSRATQDDMPIVLAVIPAVADATLVEFLSQTPYLIPAVHGWSHENHAPTGTKKAEFGAHRPLVEMMDEIDHGLGRLHALLGSRVLRMFVPPWNRISDEVATGLPNLGFRYLSTFTPRVAGHAAPGVQQINTHIDPIDWKGTRGLLDESVLIARTVTLLQQRRHGQTDATEPLGLLTHHLVHDPAIWSFCARWLETMRAGPTHVWHPKFGEDDEPT